jgi:dipeptidyl aminopeptidase/acylaminoacyl peptidase
LNVWVRTVGQDDDRVVTHDRHRGIRSYLWAPNGEQILFSQDTDGDRHWHLFSVDLATETVRDLTPFEGVTAATVAVSPKYPDEILVGINKRDEQFRDVHRLNLKSGELSLLVENTEGFVGWLADHEFKVRLGAKLTDNGGFALWVRDDDESSWRRLNEWAPEDTLNSEAISFTPDGRGIYILSSTGANTSELRVMDVSTGREKTLASDRYSDVYSVFIHPQTHEVQAVSYYKERLHWKVLDPTVRADFHAIERIRRGDFYIMNRDRDDQTWLIAFTVDDGPIHFYTFDRKSKRAEFLFVNRPALGRLTLAKTAPISFRTRDALTIHGYLTTPPNVRARDLPMVLLVHGGPWDRDRWGYNGTVQWLANRGYAVLQVNFRGSRGYGKAFINAGNKEWGGKIYQDLVDGVYWAIKRRIADPKRVAIFGSSFGGYQALVGLSTSPEMYACGVDISGFCDVATWVQSLPPVWKPYEPIIWDRVGHPERNAGLLRSHSPLYHVDNITKPLLIAHGANDPYVKTEEVRQIVDTLKKLGRSVEYVEYADEGHEFARPENRLDFYAKAEKFLSKHLGGRYED